MVDRNKKTEICEKGSLEEGMISKLPDVVICDKILIHLPTKDSVRTSVLSTKWKNLWKWVPGLELDSRAFSNLDAFVNFGDMFFDSHKESWIRKLKLSIHDSDVDGRESYLSSWINAVTNRKIQELDVCFDCWDHLNEIPLSIYTCETLVQLRLNWAALVDAEFVSLPCLKVMHLDWVKSLNYEATVEKLISGSPVLEDLTIITCITHNRNVIEVHSQTLKRIHINAYTEVVIDAPLLQRLKTQIFHKKNFEIISSGFPAKVKIRATFNILDILPFMIRRIEVGDILTDVSKVRDLTICCDLSNEIFLYLKLEPLLQFPYLSHLTAGYYRSDLEFLPTLLESCPNLQSLILELFEDPPDLFDDPLELFLELPEISKDPSEHQTEDKKPVVNQTEEKKPVVILSTVPLCLISSLKFVELKRSKPESDDEGHTELVEYFLKNSTSLEKLRLSNYFTEKAKHGILVEDLLAMPRCSSVCEVIVL